MTDKRTLGQGNVEVQLTNEHGEQITKVLKPSIHAMRVLSRKYGGLQPLIKRVADMDFDTIVDVLEVGLQIPQSPKARQELEGLVYHTGFTDATGQLPMLCVRFVTVLMHGGRMPPEQQAAEADGPLQPSAA